MRVAFDEQVFIGQRHGGISRYFVELIVALRAEPGLLVEPEVGWVRSVNEFAQATGLGQSGPVVGTRQVTAALCLAANTRARRKARRAPVLHHTHYLRSFLRGRSGAPRVVTVHDMTPELFPDLFLDGNPHFAKREYVRQASLVVCPSESTRSDLIDVYGRPDAPVVVVPHGVSAQWFTPQVGPGGGAPYLVFVGQRGGYKDFDVVVRAMARVDSSVELVCVGGGAFTADESRALGKLGLTTRVRQRGASDAELAELYAGALAFVYPSRYEGFGLPTLEAMAAGCPVVLARGSSHPEVGGDVARYFEPGDDAALAALIDQFGGDEVARSTLVSLGIERARAFSWSRTASLTAAAYTALGP